MAALLNAVYRALHGIAVAIDFGIAMMIWFRLEAPMTISSHAGLVLRAGERTTLLALLGRFLNVVDPGHTDASIEADRVRCRAALERLSM